MIKIILHNLKEYTYYFHFILTFIDHALQYCKGACVQSRWLLYFSILISLPQIIQVDLKSPVPEEQRLMYIGQAKCQESEAVRGISTAISIRQKSYF